MSVTTSVSAKLAGNSSVSIVIHCLVFKLPPFGPRREISGCSIEKPKKECTNFLNLFVYQFVGRAHRFWVHVHPIQRNHDQLRFCPASFAQHCHHSLRVNVW